MTHRGARLARKFGFLHINRASLFRWGPADPNQAPSRHSTATIRQLGVESA
ncbi:MAG: hypothetical protein ACI9MC_002742 [Kiritimatiellia bacterium]